MQFSFANVDPYRSYHSLKSTWSYNSGVSFALSATLFKDRVSDGVFMYKV